MPDPVITTSVFGTIKDIGTVISVVVIPLSTLLYFKYVKTPMDKLKADNKTFEDECERIFTELQSALSKNSDSIDKINKYRTEEAVRDEETRSRVEELKVDLKETSDRCRNMEISIAELRIINKERGKNG